MSRQKKPTDSPPRVVAGSTIRDKDRNQGMVIRFRGSSVTVLWLSGLTTQIRMDDIGPGKRYELLPDPISHLLRGR